LLKEPVFEQITLDNFQKWESTINLDLLRLPISEVSALRFQLPPAQKDPFLCLPCGGPEVPETPNWLNTFQRLLRSNISSRWAQKLLLFVESKHDEFVAFRPENLNHPLGSPVAKLREEIDADHPVTHIAHQS
jgi:hypothetical protein